MRNASIPPSAGATREAADYAGMGLPEEQAEKLTALQAEGAKAVKPRPNLDLSSFSATQSMPPMEISEKDPQLVDLPAPADEDH